MTALVIHADARSLPLASDSVDLVVTSPPYLNLRAYTDNGQAYDGQIGAESSREEFVGSLLDVMRECVRVTKPEGSIFVNLGDSYRDKTLQLTPHRFAMRCVDDLGLILRAEIVWAKPNGLPESVTDRVRRSHEVWFHFVQQPRYFSAVDEIREPHLFGAPNGKAPNSRQGDAFAAVGQRRHGSLSTPRVNPLGKLPGSVWEIATSPLTVPAHLGVDHFAAFPPEWPKRIVQGWSPAGVCVECGQGRRPVVDATPRARFDGEPMRHGTAGVAASGLVPSLRGGVRSLTGYACACDHPTAPTRPGVVLDCFGGTGTTALVASALGRVGISTDLSADYCRLARWRTTDRGERARVLGVPKPPIEVSGQADLFGEDVA